MVVAELVSVGPAIWTEGPLQCGYEVAPRHLRPQQAIRLKPHNACVCRLRASNNCDERSVMRPYIICHMLSSLDGRIDGAALKGLYAEDEYEATGAELKGDGWICGRTTMQQHFAEQGEFVSKSGEIAGPQDVFVARHAASYAICVDTLGKLLWAGGDLDGDHLICVVSERVPGDYLAMLRENQISYIVTGARDVDLEVAVCLLAEHFEIHTLLLEGGGHINGAFADADLIDEISLVLAAGIDGRKSVPAVFDGMNLSTQTAIPLKLKSVEKRKKDALWLRYDVTQP
jgi:2,5-diamino-6-(ribosylamino)-4(3H)-pyrimidinone 5'-phosphate reductase